MSNQDPIVKIFREQSNDPDSVFIYIPNVFSEPSQQALMKKLNELPDFKQNFNFNEKNICTSLNQWVQIL